jgi:superfamily II DNA or RNA helicase
MSIVDLEPEPEPGYEPEPERIIDDCDIKQLNVDIKHKRQELKKLNTEMRRCKSRDFKYKNDGELTMIKLLEIIKKENKSSVKEFLKLFPSTEERVKGISVTRNHVYEALWIIVYLKELDNPSKKRQFYKSLENQQRQSYEEVLNGKVNSGNEGGIADIYFEMIGEDEDEEVEGKMTCNGQDISIPHCENKITQAYAKYLFSSKFYRKTKGVSNYDIQDIFTEAVQKGLKEFNIVLLVQDKHELEKKMDTSNKSLSKLCHDIYDISDLDLYYKQLLFQLKNKTESLEEVKKYIKPRFHQQYFINYTTHCMDKLNSKKFVWGAVPRSGKSYMIAGLVAKDKPRYVFLILGAITETKEQFIKMFKENNGDFEGYKIHDLQLSHGKPLAGVDVEKNNHIFVCSQEAIRMHNKQGSVNPEILKIFKTRKDKIIFFDEIHQGSGEESLQADFLTELVFDNEYKAFIMVTATFAKPFLKYMNKGGEDTKLIQWRYDDIHLMKSIDKKIIDEETGGIRLVTYNKLRENILEENDGKIKIDIFDKLRGEWEFQGVNLERLASQYKIYPELIVSTPIISDIDDEFSNIIVNGNIAVDKIFKPLMKLTPTDVDTARNFIKYIQKGIYEKYILQTLNKGSILRKPHSEIWFLPTMFRREKGVEIIQEENKKGKSPFGNMTKNFTTLLMQNEWFKSNYCVIILHSVGFDNVNIDFIQAREMGGKPIKWNDADVQHTGNHSCISTICPSSKLGVKECILQQEACARSHGKSVIILTGKMLRLGVSLPCVDIALHMDPIQSVDTIYQSMFRVLTEREGKTEGIFIDMLTTRQISFMYEYMNYVSKTEKVFSGQKKMKKLLEKLLLFNFNGINFQNGQEYHDLYNKLMKEFSLDDVNQFNKNIRAIDVSEVEEMLHGFDERFIEEFHSLLDGLNISYKAKKKNKEKKKLIEREGEEMEPDEYREVKPMDSKNPLKVKKSPELKVKYEEVSRFIKDMIMLFSLFSSDTYDDIHDTQAFRKKILKDIQEFFKKNIDDIKSDCDSLNLDDYSVIDCHLLNIIKNSVKEDELQGAYNILKGKLRDLFSDILKDDNFFKIYYDNIEEMKKVKASSNQLKSVKPCSNDFIKDEKVLGIIRDRLTVRDEEKNLYGEVFTPIELICEMLEHIPKEVWKNPDLKWLDPANGIGNFPVVAYYKLMDSLKDYKPKGKSLSRHIIEDMLYMVELNAVNVRVCKKIFKMIDPKAEPNIVKANFLEFKGFRGVDKFDVIMGNPPFQKKVGPKKTQPTWNLFTIDSINKYLNKDGYLVFVHPNGWREGRSGSFKKVYENLIERDLISLTMRDYKAGAETFGGSGTNYDYYCLRNTPSRTNKTKINDIDRKISIIDLNDYDFIPSGMFDVFQKLKGSGDNKVDIIYDRSMYGSDKSNMNMDKKGDFIHPCVYTITQQKGVTLMYSNEKKDMFGKNNAKVIWSNGAGTYPIIDAGGNYGLTQFSYGIKDNPKVLKHIKQAMEHPDFIKLMKYLMGQQHKYNRKIIGTFKKDFYKHFLGKSKLMDFNVKNEKVKEKPKPEFGPEPEVEFEPEPAKVKTPMKPEKVTEPKKPEPKTIKKSKCTKAHPPGPPCKDGQYSKPPHGCCYKNKSTKKKTVAKASIRKRKRKKSKRTKRKKKNKKRSLKWSLFK